MAILSINEFIERREQTLVLCNRCYGIAHEASMSKLDALKFVFGLKNIPKRYKCPDCGCEIKKDN
jgi:hypothetical protein